MNVEGKPGRFSNDVGTCSFHTEMDTSIPDLFSMGEVDSGLGLVSPSDIMNTEEDQGEPLSSLKEGSTGADRTLSSLNTRGGRLMSMPLPSPPPLSGLEMDTSSTSDVKGQTLVSVKEEFFMEDENVTPLLLNASFSDHQDLGAGYEDKENEAKPVKVNNLTNLMNKPTVAPTKSKQLKRDQSKAQVQEKKRPGRKRLELPSEEEVLHMTDPKMKKRLQNRKASRECRARKADYLGEIEERVRQLETENAELSFKYTEEVKERTKVDRENEQLRLRLDEFVQRFKSMNVSCHFNEIAVC